jgi:hypothetical protein
LSNAAHGAVDKEEAGTHNMVANEGAHVDAGCPHLKMHHHLCLQNGCCDAENGKVFGGTCGGAIRCMETNKKHTVLKEVWEQRR